MRNLSLNPVEEDVPDDLETSDRYIAIPHKNDLDLGRRLALRFAAQELPDRYEQAKDFFRRLSASLPPRLGRRLTYTLGVSSKP
jgi:hypothetical protein